MKRNKECPLCHEEGGKLYFQHTKSRRVFYRCGVCDLVFANRKDLLDRSEERRRYAQHENSNLDEGYRAFLQPSVEGIRDLYQSGWIGLDYGCGPYPALAEILSENGIQVDTYDPAFFPDLKEKKYDFLVSTEVVEHFHDVNQEWRKILSVIGLSAPVVIMTNRHDEVSDFSGWHYWRDETHVSFYSQKTFQWIGERFSYHCEFPHERVAILKPFSAF